MLSYNGKEHADLLNILSADTSWVEAHNSKRFLFQIGPDDGGS